MSEYDELTSTLETLCGGNGVDKAFRRQFQHMKKAATLFQSTIPTLREKSSSKAIGNQGVARLLHVTRRLICCFSTDEEHGVSIEGQIDKHLGLSREQRFLNFSLRFCTYCVHEGRKACAHGCTNVAELQLWTVRMREIPCGNSWEAVAERLEELEDRCAEIETALYDAARPEKQAVAAEIKQQENAREKVRSLHEEIHRLGQRLEKKFAKVPTMTKEAAIGLMWSVYREVKSSQLSESGTGHLPSMQIAELEDMEKLLEQKLQEASRKAAEMGDMLKMDRPCPHPNCDGMNAPGRKECSHCEKELPQLEISGMDKTSLQCMYVLAPAGSRNDMIEVLDFAQASSGPDIREVFS